MFHLPQPHVCPAGDEAFQICLRTNKKSQKDSSVDCYHIPVQYYFGSVSLWSLKWVLDEWSVFQSHGMGKYNMHISDRGFWHQCQYRMVWVGYNYAFHCIVSVSVQLYQSVQQGQSVRSGVTCYVMNIIFTVFCVQESNTPRILSLLYTLYN